jgi:hypothetical protein
MKTKLITTLTFLSLLIFTGCSNKEMSMEEKQELLQEQKEKMKKEIEELPSWILKPESDKCIAAVGMSTFSKHGLHSMLTLAEMDGRAKLAGKMQIIVSQLQEKSMRAMKIEQIDELEDIFNQVTKEVIKEVSISSVKRENVYQGNDGTLYVLMTLDKSNISNQLKDVYTEHINDAKISKKNLDQGMLVLDEMLDKLNNELKQ